MEAFNCLFLHHLITHRLSRIETCDYQDKEGCSLNGSNEFLKEIGILRCYSLDYFIFDSRGVIFDIEYGETSHHSQEFDKTMLNFKQFVGIVRSTISIVEEERKHFKAVLKFLDPSFTNSTFQQLVKSPTQFFTDNHPWISTCFGHVIRFNNSSARFEPGINFKQIFSSYEQLPYLKSLNCLITHFELDSDNFLEEFGDVFGSKLVRLKITIYDCEFSSNQIEDCFSQFINLRSLVLCMNILFNPSFCINCDFFYGFN